MVHATVAKNLKLCLSATRRMIMIHDDPIMMVPIKVGCDYAIEMTVETRPSPLIGGSDRERSSATVGYSHITFFGQNRSGSGSTSYACD
jgi:hypothetical protein